MSIEEDVFNLRADLDALIKERKADRDRIAYLEFRLLPDDLSRRMQQEIEDYRHGD